MFKKIYMPSTYPPERKLPLPVSFVSYQKNTFKQIHKHFFFHTKDNMLDTIPFLVLFTNCILVMLPVDTQRETFYLH